jgi:hypothetical protein
MYVTEDEYRRQNSVEENIWMEIKDKNRKTEGKDEMSLKICTIHLTLIRTNNLETCTHT